MLEPDQDPEVYCPTCGTRMVVKSRWFESHGYARATGERLGYHSVMVACPKRKWGILSFHAAFPLQFFAYGWSNPPESGRIAG